MPAHFQWFLTLLLPVHADTNVEYDTEIFSKNPTLNIHLHHYTNTKKVIHKVKYLLTTLIQDENRERTNVYLKIFYEN